MTQIPQRILYFQSSSCLKNLAEASFCLTPKVYLPKNEVLYLDIAETQKALGGQAKILSTFERLTTAFEVEGETVLTDRIEWAKLFIGSRTSLISAGESAKALLGLPIERLKFCGNPLCLENEEKERNYLIAFMQRIGLFTVGQFLRLNSQAIQRRFGKLGCQLFASLKGEQPVALPLFLPVEGIFEYIDTDEIYSLEQLIFYLSPLLKRLEARLQGRCLEAKCLKITYSVDSGNHFHTHLKLSYPTWDSNILIRNFKTHLEKVHWDSPLQRIQVEVTESIPYVAGQLSLLDLSENKVQDLSHYVQNLREKYGRESVGFAKLLESYLPERSFKMQWPPEPASPQPPLAKRPPFLYSPPRPLRLMNHLKMYPSENLSTEWWEDGGQRRYFLAQTPKQEWLWIYFDLQRQSWYLHGSFD